MKHIAAAIVASVLTAIAQSPPPAAQQLSFEVASIKSNKSGDLGDQIRELPGGRFSAINMTPRVLITWAYQLRDFQLLAAPDWIRSERFDLAGTLGRQPPSTPEPNDVVTGSSGTMRAAVRTLLAERFGLVVHREAREFPIHVLVLARPDGKLGPMLTRSTTDCSDEAIAARRTAGLTAGLQPRSASAEFCGSRFMPSSIRFVQRGCRKLVGSAVERLRYGLRQWRRSPAFTLLAVSALAIGVGRMSRSFRSSTRGCFGRWTRKSRVELSA